MTATIPNLSRIPAYDAEEKTLNVLIETPKDSPSKFKYDPELGLFKLNDVLSKGIRFPYDFGFIPSTKGEDGDPIDVLLIMDEPAFPGCLVPSRLIGVIEAEQTEKGKTIRNDRLIAVAVKSFIHQDVHSLDDLNPRLLDEIEHFFLAYTSMLGKEFKPLARRGPEQATKLVKEAQAK